jgi:hypothetical protein
MFRLFRFLLKLALGFVVLSVAWVLLCGRAGAVHADDGG